MVVLTAGAACIANAAAMLIALIAIEDLGVPAETLRAGAIFEADIVAAEWKTDLPPVKKCFQMVLCAAYHIAAATAALFSRATYGERHMVTEAVKVVRGGCRWLPLGWQSH
jgi:hypothetical protein